MSVFIIVGIIIVAAISLFFLLDGTLTPSTGGSSEISPNSYMESCLEDKIMEATELISAQGGYVENPLNFTFKFEDEEDYKGISYLCYNQNYYNPCIVQEPMLIQHLKDEVYNYIQEDVRNCFDDLTSSLESKGFTIDARYRDFEVELISKKVVLNIDAEITATKTDEIKEINDLKTFTSTEFYDLALVVQEIVSQEAEYCNFNHLGYMLLYPEFKIDKFETGDTETIYTVKYKKTEERFRFAIRSCVIPPGI